MWRLYSSNARRFAFWLEREIYVMPRQTALSFVQRAYVICPACGEHEEYFVSFGFRQFIEL